LLTVGRVATESTSTRLSSRNYPFRALMVDDKSVERLSDRRSRSIGGAARTHRMSVVATDSDGLQSSAFAAVTESERSAGGDTDSAGSTRRLPWRTFDSGHCGKRARLQAVAVVATTLMRWVPGCTRQLN